MHILHWKLLHMAENFANELWTLIELGETCNFVTVLLHDPMNN